MRVGERAGVLTVWQRSYGLLVNDVLDYALWGKTQGTKVQQALAVAAEPPDSKKADVAMEGHAEATAASRGRLRPGLLQEVVDCVRNRWYEASGRVKD